MKTPAIFALMLTLMASAVYTQTPTKAQDPWIGTWQAMAADARAGNVLLTKEKDGYRLEMAGYQTFRFTEKSPGVLECKHLGLIRRGKMSMAGIPGETAVLHAEFCYEHFYLLYAGPSR